MATLQELFDAARDGDRSAFDAMVLHYTPQLRGFVGSRLGDALRRRVEIEDVIQETSLKAFRALDQIQWQGEEALGRWFCRISLNVIYGYSRKDRKVEVVASDREQTAEITSPSRHAQREERFDRLQASLHRLTADQRMIIQLTCIEGKPVREAASVMNRSIKATNQLLWRATTRLREVFGDTGSLRLPADRQLEQPQTTKSPPSNNPAGSSPND